MIQGIRVNDRVAGRLQLTNGKWGEQFTGLVLVVDPRRPHAPFKIRFDTGRVLWVNRREILKRLYHSKV